MSWREQGACWDTRLLDFFLDQGQSSRRVKALCANCKVRAECLDYALSRNIKLGIWGGLAPRERMDIKRKRRVA